jgi:hypothetical protein
MLLVFTIQEKKSIKLSLAMDINEHIWTNIRAAKAEEEEEK